ncbi:jg16484 [Pararge aegeria aegeria]|uniref:Jg16484 protein n=1 Tax=Pararge aegeria aegeria TaxID=348720 RepID=A0A8S4RG86_9NEOP|nr:jg16484 [Pararge aegeria aegeria]
MLFLSIAYVNCLVIWSRNTWTLTHAMSNKLEGFEMMVDSSNILGRQDRQVRYTTVLQRKGKYTEILRSAKKKIMRNPIWNLLLLRRLRARVGLVGCEFPACKNYASDFSAKSNKINLALMVANLR